MSSKGNWRSFRQKSLTQSGKRSIESLLTPAGLLAESLQSLQVLGRMVFQPDLAHNFHKPSFVSGSQHFCQVKFRFFRFSPLFRIQTLSTDTGALFLFHYSTNIIILRQLSSVLL